MIQTLRSEFFDQNQGLGLPLRVADCGAPANTLSNAIGMARFAMFRAASPVADPSDPGFGMRTSEKRRGDVRKSNCKKCWGPPISRHEMAPPNSKYSDQSEECVERGAGFTTPSCSLIFKTFPLASRTFRVSGGSTSLSMGGVNAVGSSSNCQPAASERLPRIARTHLALLSTTLIAMGAVILYLSSICHSRSSPSYTFNSHSAVSVHSERTIVKSSIFCAISTVLAAGLESSESKI
jgi:hypothetical protein